MFITGREIIRRSPWARGSCRTKVVRPVALKQWGEGWWMEKRIHERPCGSRALQNYVYSLKNSKNSLWVQKMDLLDVSRTVSQDLKHHMIQDSGLSWASSPSGGFWVGGLEGVLLLCCNLLLFSSENAKLGKKWGMKCREVQWANHFCRQRNKDGIHLCSPWPKWVGDASQPGACEKLWPRN